MGSLLKGLVIAAGAGLGVCVGAVLLAPGSGMPRRRTQRELSEAELLRLDPILDRLERVEAYVDAAASAPVLSARVAELEGRAGAALDQVRSNFEDLKQELPSLVEAAVSARVADLEARLKTDAHQSWDRAVSVFETTIGQKVSDRIGSLEKVLAEQSSAIASLRARSAETDVNLQRLIVSIDRLCEVAPMLSAQAPQADPLSGGPHLVKEPDRESKRLRVPMARIFGALLAFGFSRFFQ